MKKTFLCIIKIIAFTLAVLAASLVFEIVTALVFNVTDLLTDPGAVSEMYEAGAGVFSKHPNEMMFFGKIAMSSVAIGLYIGFYRKEENGFSRSIKGNTVIFTIVAGVSIQLVISILLGFIIPLLPVSTADDYNEVMNSLSAIDVCSVLSVVVLAPLSEEFLCRGVIQRCAEEAYSKTGAVFVQAVVFGLIHMQLIQSTYAFIIGIVLGYFSMKYRTIWISFFIHMALNAASYFLPYIPDTVGISGININMVFVIYGFTILISVVTVILFKKLPKPDIRTAEEVAGGTV